MVTIGFDKEDVVIVNNEGKSTYTFTENGSFTFEYVYDGNAFASETVEVDWIKKTVFIKYYDGALLKEDVIAYGSGYQVLYTPENTDGKVFSHWVGADGAIYYEGDILSPEDDLTLTAVYEKTDDNGNDNDNDNDNDNNGGGDNNNGGNNGSSDGENKPKKSNAGLIAGIIIAVLVVAAGAATAVIIVIKKKKQ